MESGGKQDKVTKKEDGSSMTPIAWHCMQTNALLRKISEDSSTLNSTKQDRMHGPAGAGHVWR